MKKLIDLPEDIVKAIEKLAEKDRRLTKNYIEKIIIDFIEKMRETGKV